LYVYNDEDKIKVDVNLLLAHAALYEPRCKIKIVPVSGVKSK